MKNLKYLRINHHLSQSELSKLLHVSQQSICKYENGHSEANETFLIKTASFFGTSVDYLLGLSNSPTNNSYPHNPLEEAFHLHLYQSASKEQQYAIDTLLKACIYTKNN